MRQEHCCETMSKHLQNRRVQIGYSPRVREYFIRLAYDVPDDSLRPVQLIQFCPWCGSKLPTSLRDEWCERMEALGLEPLMDQAPPELATDTWWRGKT